MELFLKPIGIVVERGERSRIEVFKEYAAGLDHIEKFSHIMILYWLHKVPSELRRTLKLKPRFDYVPLLGVFATRFPARPNPIGVTTVKLAKRKGRILIVQGFDAEEGTPIIDLKPYIPIYDNPHGEVVLPEWVRRGLKEHHHAHGDHVHDAFDTFEKIMKMVKVYTF